MFLATPLILGVLISIFKADAANILAIYPWPAYSHQVVHNQLTVALAKRGHQMTVFTPKPMNKHIPNYTEHSLSHLSNIFRGNLNYVQSGKKGTMFHFPMLMDLTAILADEIWSNEHLKEYISPNSTKKFDLLISATAHTDSLYYLSHLLKTPLIIVSTGPAYAFNLFESGTPTLPSSFPDVMLGFTDKMNFWQRIANLIQVIRQWHGFYYVAVQAQEKVLRKHFGDNVPSIDELRQGVTLLLQNTHPLLHYPRPMTPNVVQIAGLRMGVMNKTLPEPLKSILDDANEGFIYFSLGSNINSTDLGPEMIEQIVSVFAELPYKVLWKFDADSLIHHPKNVIIHKWIPQFAVLAHPNIKLFIYQGGLQSTEEAIENSVPLLGIPIIFDQAFNVEALKRKGVAESVDLYTMTRKEFREKIYQLILNPKYKENMKKLWALFSHRMHHPLEEAVWWCEYVIKHKGAPYLQSPRLPWYKYHMIDIYIFFVTILLIIYHLCRWLLRFVVSHFRNRFGSSESDSSKSKKLKSS
uniref:EGT_1 protein n=1 Tax=Fopius arisanus TaxID=64838 RepID=A0A0C9RBG1_9HYME